MSERGPDGVILEVLSSGECGFDNVCDRDGTQSRNIVIAAPAWLKKSAGGNAECIRVTDGVSCDDAAFCTVDDTCLDGICTGSARDCDDQNSCTLDSCSQSLGCISDLDEAICDSDTLSCQALEQCRTMPSAPTNTMLAVAARATKRSPGVTLSLPVRITRAVASTTP